MKKYEDQFVIMLVAMSAIAMTLSVPMMDLQANSYAGNLPALTFSMYGIISLVGIAYWMKRHRQFR